MWAILVGLPEGSGRHVPCFGSSLALCVLWVCLGTYAQWMGNIMNWKIKSILYFQTNPWKNIWPGFWLFELRHIQFSSILHQSLFISVLFISGSSVTFPPCSSMAKFSCFAQLQQTIFVIGILNDLELGRFHRCDMSWDIPILHPGTSNITEIYARVPFRSLNQEVVTQVTSLWHKDVPRARWAILPGACLLWPLVIKSVPVTRDEDLVSRPKCSQTQHQDV